MNSINLELLVITVESKMGAVVLGGRLTWQFFQTRLIVHPISCGLAFPPKLHISGS